MVDYKFWFIDLIKWIKDVKDNELKDVIDKFVELE